MKIRFAMWSNVAAKGLRPGGYGVLLAQKLVIELIYNEKGNEVIFLFVKYVRIKRGGRCCAPLAEGFISKIFAVGGAALFFVSAQFLFHFDV